MKQKQQIKNDVINENFKKKIYQEFTFNYFIFMNTSIKLLSIFKFFDPEEDTI